jgi:hypothetical protein
MLHYGITHFYLHFRSWMTCESNIQIQINKYIHISTKNTNKMIFTLSSQTSILCFHANVLYSLRHIYIKWVQPIHILT